jgi:60 kDa SS-A/Ro ribonucleoprotein
MKTNAKRKKAPVRKPRTPVRTHNNAPADAVAPYLELRRSVLSCLLWENEFYESGATIAARIRGLCHLVTPDQLANLAIKARTDYKLRHMPLFLARELARHERADGGLVARTIEHVIARADEIAEFMAIYWKDGKQPIANAVKRGLAAAFKKFDAYQIAKYNREKEIELRDVMFMVHAKPADIGERKGKKNKPINRSKGKANLPKLAPRSSGYKRGATFRHKSPHAITLQQLADNELPAPNTWEARIGAGEDYKEVMSELLDTNKLGYMALLRNLRKLEDAGVDRRLVVQRMREGAPKAKLLPFQFIAAAVHAPRFEDVIDECMLLSLEGFEKLRGKTALLIDNSGSMYQAKVSAKSELTRAQAAQALAVIARELCEDVSIYAFSTNLALIPPRRGVALTQAIDVATPHGGTYLGAAIRAVNEKEDYDRLIVFTDEQSRDPVGPPRNGSIGYIINVASNRYGVGYDTYVKIDGFSEQVIRYIQTVESGGE